MHNENEIVISRKYLSELIDCAKYRLGSIQLDMSHRMTKKQELLEHYSRLIQKVDDLMGQHQQGKSKPHSVDKMVQVKNPKTGRYIKIDRSDGTIVEHKDTDGPYEDIPFV